MKRRQLSVRERFEILLRAGFRCEYCGARATEAALEVDHIRPHSKDGPCHKDNFAVACETCNGGKAARVLPGLADGEPATDTDLSTIASAIIRLIDAREIILVRWRASLPSGAHRIFAYCPTSGRIVREHANPPMPEEVWLIQDAIADIGRALGSLDLMKKVSDLVEEEGGIKSAVILDHRWTGIHGWYA